MKGYFKKNDIMVEFYTITECSKDIIATVKTNDNIEKIYHGERKEIFGMIKEDFEI